MISPVSGGIFERRLIEKHLIDNDSGAELLPFPSFGGGLVVLSAEESLTLSLQGTTVEITNEPLE